jgi:hypothetical protein
MLSLHQNAGKNRDIKSENKSFENMSQLKYFRTTVTDTNLLQEEIKRTLNFGNACYHPTQNFLSSSLLSKNVKITSRIYKTTVFPVVLYGCQTRFLILREEHRCGCLRTGY